MDIINIILPVFLIIGLGFALRAVRFINREANSALSRLVFYVAAPALLFHGTAQTPLRRSLNFQALLLIAGVTLVIGFLVYIAGARSLPQRRGVLAQGAHRSNMVFVGLPIIANAYGNPVLGPAAILIGFLVLWYNFLAVLFLTLPHRQAGTRMRAMWVSTAAKMIKNPLIIGCAGGILFSAFGIKIPVSLDRSLELVGRTALPLALISVGAGLEFGKLRAEMAAAAIVSAMKLVIYPGLAYFGLRALGFTGVDLEVPVLLLATPTAVVSYIMAREMNGDERLAGAIVIGTTIASFLTISAWLVLFKFM